jgi:hypothetical protein
LEKNNSNIYEPKQLKQPKSNKFLWPWSGNHTTFKIVSESKFDIKEFQKLFKNEQR